jgi:hypothetical protein
MSRTVTSRAVSLIALLVVLAAPAARAVVIDDFTVAPIDLHHVLGQSGNAQATQTGLDPLHVAGGVRTWRFGTRAQFASNPPAGSGVSSGVRMEPAPHLYYDADDLVTAINYQVLYNAGATNTSQPGLNLDLAALKHNALAIDFNYALFDDNNGRMDIQAGPYIFTSVPNSATPFRLIHPLSKSLDASGVIKSIIIGTSNGYLFGSFEIARISTISTADANGDGAVDGGDFLTWQRNLGTMLPTSASNAERVAMGDVDLSRTVDARDHALWRTMMSGAGPSTGQTPVPEPATVVIAALVKGALVRCARQRPHTALCARPCRWGC